MAMITTTYCTCTKLHLCPPHTPTHSCTTQRFCSHPFIPFPTPFLSHPSLHPLSYTSLTHTLPSSPHSSPFPHTTPHPFHTLPYNCLGIVCPQKRHGRPSYYIPEAEGRRTRTVCIQEGKQSVCNHEVQYEVLQRIMRGH